MLEISLLVLVLQIGFNAALNYHGNNQNLLIPSSRSISYGQTRRFDSNNYLPVSSRRFPASDSDQSDSEDSSLEESNYHALRPLQSLTYQRRNSLRYNTRSDNDVSLEAAPISKIGSDNYADTYQSVLSPTRRADTDFRRPYLRSRNLKQSANLNNRRERGDNDLSVEISPVDENNALVTLRGSRQEDANYLRSLLPLGQPNLRRSQNRKYHRKRDNNLSFENSSVESLDSDEDALESLQTSRSASLGDTRYREPLLSNNRQSHNRRASENLLKTVSDRLVFGNDNGNSNSLRSLQSNQRRNNRLDSKSDYDLRLQIPSPTNENPDAYIDTVLLVGGEGKPDDIAIARPQLRNELSNLNQNKNDRRRYNDRTYLDLLRSRLSPDDDESLYSVQGLNSRLRSRELTSDGPNPKIYWKDDGSIDVESLLNEIMSFYEEEATSNEDLPKLRSRYQNQRNNRQDQRNFLRLALSPNDGLSLDEDLASKLSVLLAENIDDLNLVPATSLRSNVVSNQRNNRRNNVETTSTEEDTSSNLTVLRLGSLDNSNAEPLLLRYLESRNRNNNLRSRKGKLSNSRLRSRDLTSDGPNPKIYWKDDGSIDVESLLNEIMSFYEEEATSNKDLPKLRSRYQNQRNNRQDQRNFLRLALSPNDGLSLDEDLASKLSVLLAENIDDLNLVPATGLRSNVVSNQRNNRRNNVETTSTEEDTLGNLSVLRLGSLDNSNAEPLLLRYLESRNRNNNLRSRKGKLSNSRLRSRELTSDGPNPKIYWKDDGSIDVESLLNEIMSFYEEEATSNKDLPKLRSRYQNQRNNRLDQRNFLRLALSPNDGLSLDEDLASRLSVLLAENIDDLNLVPATGLRSNVVSNQRNNRRNNVETTSTEEDTSNNLSVLRLGSLDNSNAEPLLLRYLESRNRNNNLRSRKSNKKKGHELTDKLKDNAAVDLVPYQERRSSGPAKDNNNQRKNNNRKNDDEFDDEFNIDSLFNNKKDDADNLIQELSSNDRLDLDDNPANDLSVLSATSLKNADQIQSNRRVTTDVLYREIPWNGQLSPDHDDDDDDESSNLSAFRGLKPRLRSREHTDSLQSKDPKDYELKLEYPWNGEPSSDDEDSNLSKSQLRSSDNAADLKNYKLKLDYPWNGKLNPDDDDSHLSKSQLRNSEKTGLRNSELKLEYPWNGNLSPDNDKDKSKSQLRSSEKSNDFKNSELHLEYPWNGKLSPDDVNDINLSKSRLRSSDNTDNLQNSDQKKYELKLEYPWNGQLETNDDNKNGKVTKSQIRSENSDSQNVEPEHDLKLEYPWNGNLSPDDDAENSIVSYLKKKFLMMFFNLPIFNVREYDSEINNPKKYRTLDPDNSTTKKPALRVGRVPRVPDPSYEHPYLRNINRNRYSGRRTNIDFYIEDRALDAIDSQTGAKPYQRKSYKNGNDNNNLRVPSIARQGPGASSFIALPLDRRPHPRLRSRDDTYLKQRRANGRVATNASPNIARSNQLKTYNDTIIFRDNN